MQQPQKAGECLAGGLLSADSEYFTGGKIRDFPVHPVSETEEIRVSAFARVCENRTNSDADSRGACDIFHQGTKIMWATPLWSALLHQFRWTALFCGRNSPPLR